MIGAIEADVGRLLGISRVEDDGPVLEDGGFRAALSGAGDFVGAHEYVETVAAREAKEWAALGVGFDGLAATIGLDVQLSQGANDGVVHFSVQGVDVADGQGVVERKRQRISQFEIVKDGPTTGLSPNHRQLAGGRSKGLKVGIFLEIAQGNRRGRPSVESQGRRGGSGGDGFEDGFVASHVSRSVGRRVDDEA